MLPSNADRSLATAVQAPVTTSPPLTVTDRPTVTDRRPWGSFDLLALNEPVSVKIITVAPGQRLSLQRHTSRDEWWHILDDGLIVEIDGTPRAVTSGDQAWIPRGATHRISNSGTAPARFLELAFGHFDEDDIERLEDDYARPSRPTHP